MRFPSTSLVLLAAGLFAQSPAVAEYPHGANCDVLPDGFCHRRTTKDFEFVKWWNEQQKSPPNLFESKHLRRSLPEIPSAPNATFAPFAPGEYEPVEGILLAFDGSSSGSSTYDLDVVAGIASGVTRPGGAKVFMVANNQQRPVAESAFVKAGVDMAKVEWINEDINSVWIRDYGPRFICDPVADLKAAVDTKYYSNRVLDDILPVELGKADREPRFGHNNYNLNSVLHSGGNGHYFSTNKSFSSKLMVNDNTGFTEQQLKDYWKAYHGVDLHFFDQLSFSVDGTGHIDMWFLPVNDNAVIVGQWAQEDAYGSKAITDSAAKYMQDNGYTVYRTPNWSSKTKFYGYSTHFTYTNAVIANEIVIISKFNLEPQDTTALNVYQAAFPSKTIVQVDSSRIISRSGALHCIVQHVYDCGLSGPPPIEPTTSSPTAPTAPPTNRPTSLPTTPQATCVAPGGACSATKVCCSGSCPSKTKKCPLN